MVTLLNGSNMPIGAAAALEQLNILLKVGFFLCVGRLQKAPLDTLFYHPSEDLPSSRNVVPA